MPDLPAKLLRFVTSLVSHVAAGAPMASDGVIAERYAECLVCPHFQANRCQLCGCCTEGRSRWFNKLSWADQECPDSPPRWSRVDARLDK